VSTYRLEPDPIVFLGTADGTIDDGSVSVSSLEMEIRILSVLGYQTALGAPFLWQSRPVLPAFQGSRALFDAEAGPRLTGRSATPTIGDYLEQRSSDTHGASGLLLTADSLFRAEQPSEDNRELARKLAPYARIVPRAGSVEGAFKSLFLQDTSIGGDGESISVIVNRWLASRFSETGRRRAQDILSRASDKVYSEHFSRAAVEDSLLRSDLSGDAVREVLTRTSAIYQAANGLAHSRVLFTLPHVAAHLERIKDLLVISRCSVHPMNPYFFLDTLRPLGVTARHWTSVNGMSIVSATNTVNPLRAFAELYKQFFLVKLIDWSESGYQPSYSTAVRSFRRVLLRDDDRSKLERVLPLSQGRLPPLVIGTGAGMLGLAMGTDPIRSASTAKTIAEFGLKFASGFGLVETIALRKLLRSYLQSLKLAS
jgi:hypothetical protein